MKHPLILAASLTLLLGGCDLTDPYQRPGNWRPLGVNDANLAVMVVEKRELVQGTTPGESDGQLAAAAVDRLRRNRVKQLPSSNVSDLKTTSTSAGAAAALGGSE